MSDYIYHTKKYLVSMILFLVVVVCPIAIATEVSNIPTIRADLNEAVAAEDSPGVIEALVDMKTEMNRNPNNISMRRELISMLSASMVALADEESYHQWRELAMMIIDIETILSLPTTLEQIDALHWVGPGSVLIINATGISYLDKGPIAESVDERLALLSHYLGTMLSLRQLAADQPGDENTLWDHDPDLANDLVLAGYSIAGAVNLDAIRDDDLKNRLRHAMTAHKKLIEQRRLAEMATGVSNVMWRSLIHAEIVQHLLDFYQVDRDRLKDILAPLDLTPEDLTLLMPPIE